jgi:hypothetical protein
MNGIFFSLGFALFLWFILMVIWCIKEIKITHAKNSSHKKHS